MDKELTAQFESDLQSAEIIGLPAALIVLLFVFGAGVAAGVPVLIALLSIAVAMGVTAVISRFFGVNSLAVNMITMIGLAVGIDYTLFIVERFREERARGIEKLEAIGIASNTASRAVLFSGITVVIALAGMLVVPASTFVGMAIGAILVVVAAVAAALTLLPAVLSLLGDKVNFLRLPFVKASTPESSENGFWARTTRIVVAHPVVAIVATVSVLLAAAAPVATIKFGSSGLRDYPGSLESVQAFRVLDTEFSAGRLGPAHIMFEGDVNSPEFQRDVDELRQRLGSEASVAEIRELHANEDGTIANLDVIIDGDSFGPDALATVERIRNEHIPAAFDGSDTDVYVGGAAASTKDYVDTMTTYFPIVVGFVLALSFVLLTLV
ncbi:MAG: MMPL family transporter, partial [Dehalococcoidia bacterium]